MSPRVLLALFAALALGGLVGHSLRRPEADREPLRAALPAGERLTPEHLARLVAALEALERRLAEPVAFAPLQSPANPRVGNSREPARDSSPVSTPEGSSLLDVLRSIDQRLARLQAGGGLTDSSLTSGAESERRRAWLELSRRKEPMRPAALARFVSEHELAFSEGIGAELYFVEPWDLLREFGWPSELERHSVGEGGWYLEYRGLSIPTDLEESRISSLGFSFQENQLIDVSYDTD